eukprot:7655275-Pyramimonas_sp.AAC.1
MSGTAPSTALEACAMHPNTPSTAAASHPRAMRQVRRRVSAVLRSCVVVSVPQTHSDAAAAAEARVPV